MDARARLLAGIFILLGALTCSGGSALAPLVLVTPQIDSLKFYSVRPDFGRPGSGILALTAQFADTSRRLGPDERIPVKITVTSGDSETLMLGPAFCFPGPRDCTELIVTTRTGHVIDELAVLIAGIPARWWNRCPSRTCGGLRVFDSRKVDGAIRELLGNSGVEAAERDPVGALGIDMPQRSLGAQLFTAAPFDYGAARPKDGAIQGQRGDTVVLQYAQPNGTAVTTSMLVP